MNVSDRNLVGEFGAAVVNACASRRVQWHCSYSVWKY